MKKNLQTLLNDYTEKLKIICKETLNSVILYGSYARGDAVSDSDIDVMILIDVDDAELRKKNQDLIYMTFDFNLDNNTDIEPFIERSKTYKYWRNAHPFYRNIEREGKVLYSAK